VTHDYRYFTPPATSPQGSAAGNSTAIPVGVKLANVVLLGQEQAVAGKIAEKYFNDKGVDGTLIKLVRSKEIRGEMRTIRSMPLQYSDQSVRCAVVSGPNSQQAFSVPIRSPIAQKFRVLNSSNTIKASLRLC